MTTYNGTCGDNLTWTLDTDTGVLTISGTGAMTDYSSASATPWYSYKTSITSIVIGNNVSSIGSSAFRSCTALTSVTIPDSVLSIGLCAFKGCTSLTSVVVPDSVITLGEMVFQGCTALTSVTIPDSVTSLENYVFASCTGLTSVIIGNSITYIGDSPFQACTGLISVTLGKSVTTIASSAFKSSTNLATVYNASDLTLTKGSTDNGYVAYYATNVYNKGDLMYIAELNGSPIQVASAVRDENGKKIASTYATKAQLTDGSVTKVGTATVGSTSKPIYLNAGSPAALSATVGSATQPVYLNGGSITKCTYTLGASVPSGAVFTDTKCTAVGNHYSPTGTTTKSASGGATVDITGNATNVVTGVTMDAKGHVTGVVSSALKSTNSTYTVGNGTITVTQNGTTKGTFTTNQSGATTIALNDTTYSTATTSSNGLMSSSDKSKLDGVTADADSVSFTRNLTSGTIVGTITINGTDTDLFCQTNTDTHYTSKNVVGSTSATSNTTSALTNGNVYLNSVENGVVTSTHKISGSGATTVTTDASGNIVISSTDTKVAQALNESSTSSYAMLYSPYLNNNTGSSGTTSAYRTNKVYVQPSTGTLTATKFVGNVTGNCSGSSGSCTGNSATATKLTTGTTGSVTTPVYFSDGKPIACSYELTNIGRPSTWED